MSKPPTERAGRIDKARAYQRAFGTAYPSVSGRTHTVAQFLEQFHQVSTVTVAGRLRQWREHGQLIFAQVEDATGRLQLAISAEQLQVPAYDQLAWFDVSDVVAVTGQPFTTQTGEHSLLVKRLVLLAKAIRPLPDEWFGLHDEEQRYRRRYVDLSLRPELRDLFIKKARFWNSLRQFLLREGFLEVETPVLEVTPGGADAQPFMTHHNALDIDLYLRISMGELWQKRLMVAGYEKTFEIGRQFRNEGISPEHLQDYTQMEFYWAYANYEDTMALVERLYQTVIQETFGTLQFQMRDFAIDLGRPWPRLDYAQAIYDRIGINILAATDQELLQQCQRWQLSFDERLGRGRLIDMLWKHCRKQIAGPVFLINHPVAVSPLAKRCQHQPALVERYQIIIAGSELGNGYTELNDPLDQAERFEQQASLRAAGDAEAHMPDQDFVEALEYGMPPTSGFGVSERLFSFLMDKPIRECVLFPLLRPKIAGPSIAQPPALSEDDMTLGDFDPGVDRATAWQWVQDQVPDENLRRHMLATAALMERLAQHFGATQPAAWGIAGLVHDIDWEQTTPKTHSLIGADWLEQHGVHSTIVAAVREHNFMHKLEPSTIMSQALYTLEQLTGLVSAAVFVRPNKDISGLTVSSLKKKFKDKAFARGVNRDIVRQCEDRLHLSLDQVLQFCLEAMQAHAQDLGFK